MSAGSASLVQLAEERLAEVEPVLVTIYVEKPLAVLVELRWALETIEQVLSCADPTTGDASLLADARTRLERAWQLYRAQRVEKTDVMLTGGAVGGVLLLREPSSDDYRTATERAVEQGWEVLEGDIHDVDIREMNRTSNQKIEGTAVCAPLDRESRLDLEAELAVLSRRLSDAELLFYVKAFKQSLGL